MDFDTPSELTDDVDAQLGPRTGQRLAWTYRTTSLLTHDGRHHGVWGDFVAKGYKYHIAIQHLLEPGLLHRAQNADYVDDPEAYATYASEYTDEVREDLIEAAAGLSLDRILEKQAATKGIMDEPTPLEELAGTAVDIENSMGTAPVELISTIVQRVDKGNLTKDDLELISEVTNKTDGEDTPLRVLSMTALELEKEMDEDVVGLLNSIAERVQAGDLSSDEIRDVVQIDQSDDQSDPPEQGGSDVQKGEIVENTP